MVKRAPARRRPRKAKPGTKGLGPAECRLEQPIGAATEAAEAIAKAGGCVVGSYKEPLAGHPILLSVLPIDAVEPTLSNEISPMLTINGWRMSSTKPDVFSTPSSQWSHQREASGLRIAGIAPKPCAGLGRNQSLRSSWLTAR
jgi:hypothetical protein